MSDLDDLKEEIFGPVLHVVKFAADKFVNVLDQVNTSGYGLTFGLHTRVDERVQEAVNRIEAGNLYINRNQIGAVVGSQPFGGKALSGTGPKAGGPHYLLRFVCDRSRNPVEPTAGSEFKDSPDESNVESIQGAVNALRAPLDRHHADALSENYSAKDHFSTLKSLIQELPDRDYLDRSRCAAALSYAEANFHTTLDLPGPTGESNRLGMEPAGLQIALDTAGATTLDRQIWFSSIIQSLSLGNALVLVSESSDMTTVNEFLADNFPISLLSAQPDIGCLNKLTGIDGVICSNRSLWTDVRQLLANREGPILPLITEISDVSPLINEKLLCIDTTAAGGNASLLAIEQ